MLLISIASNSNLNIPHCLSCRNEEDLDGKYQPRDTFLNS